jgi:hypothetical protein
MTMDPESAPEAHESLGQAVDALFKLDADWEYEEYDEPLPWWARSLTQEDTEQIRRNREQWNEGQD